VSRLIDEERVQETIHFSSVEKAELTYTLVCDSAAMSPEVRYAGCEIAVILPLDQAMRWAGNDQVGIYATLDLGLHGVLDLVVEKDFACMDLSDADNLDAFPNPKARS
jgi:hypothetical protein